MSFNTCVPLPGAQQESEFGLSKAASDISEHGYTQNEALKEKREELCSLQAVVTDVEKRGEATELELRSNLREILKLEGDLEHLQRHSRLLWDQCTSVTRESTELQLSIDDEQEKAHVALAGYSAYRDKMETHRAVTLHTAFQTEAHKTLEEKRALVRMLTHRKEELRGDLENPRGNTVQVAKRESDALKGEIAALRKTVAEKRERLCKEFETHTQIKKDIEIQNRRYEAIVKRLHCQLSKAQAVHRQTSAEIHHMERQVAELKRQLESS
ncbi:coiled-coil domain-containing protein 122 [Genypterus blacodes]|uniref:coiled-coil domain-containing protein 122 n=1 Tax=Genypterus blacodes TaxID=154954 RepID=UPI003F771199